MILPAVLHPTISGWGEREWHMRIFISYRRGDSAPYSGRLRDALEARLGPGSVFFDVTSINTGEVFTPAIGEALAMSDVALV